SVFPLLRRTRIPITMHSCSCPPSLKGSRTGHRQPAPMSLRQELFLRAIGEDNGSLCAVAFVDVQDRSPAKVGAPAHADIDQESQAVEPRERLSSFPPTAVGEFHLPVLVADHQVSDDQRLAHADSRFLLVSLSSSSLCCHHG